jgi:O-antigen/teichoic acid export membrane protein
MGQRCHPATPDTATRVGFLNMPRGEKLEIQSLLLSSGGLFFGQVVGMGAAFLSYMAVAWLLGAEDFGRFMFLYSVSAYMAMFFDAGTSVAAGRLLALSNQEAEQRQVLGTWLSLFGLLSLAYAATLLLVALCIDRMFPFHVGRILGFCALPAIGFPLQNALRDILQGIGAHLRLSFLYVVPWGGLLIGLGVLKLTGKVSLLAVCLTLTASFFVSGVAALLTLKPRFSRQRAWNSSLWKETKRFGFHAYLARLVGTGTYQLDTPLIAYFARDPASVGFYGLAKGMAAPIALLTSSLGVASYRRLASSKRLPRETLWWGLLLLMTACLGVLLLGKPVVTGLLPKSYSGVLPLLYVWVGVAFVQGCYQLPNQFLSAQGEGVILRTMALKFSAVNLILNFSLIPVWGAMGATLASGGAYLFWLVLCIIYYTRVTRGKVRQDIDNRQASPQSTIER